MAALLSRLFNIKRIYQMLELPEVKVDEEALLRLYSSASSGELAAPACPTTRRGIIHFSQRIIESADRSALRSADHIIAHDKERARFVADALCLPVERFSLLPNAPRGGSFRKKTKFISEKLGIPSGTRIALHFGGVGPYFDLLRVVESVRNWPAGWCFVLHTSSRAELDPYMRSLRERADTQRVFFSLDPVSSSAVEEFVASADVGIATYSVDTLGYRAILMGLASGKVAQYLQCGLPVVSSDIPSLRRYLTAFDCGVCVPEPNAIGAAIGQIENRYEAFQRNAFRCYEELLNPDPACSTIADKIRDLAMS